MAPGVFAATSNTRYAVPAMPPAASPMSMVLERRRLEIASTTTAATIQSMKDCSSGRRGIHFARKRVDPSMVPANTSNSETL